MKNLYVFCIVMCVGGSAAAQCVTTATLGTASNLFTIIRNDQNPLAADKDLNMVAFIHRQNASTLGGNSGFLRYDISTNGGSTWSIDNGPLNPVNANLARYPNMAIYNPTLNTNPANAYVSYMAATINSATNTWNGLVSGVRQVSGGGNTETYNQPVVAPQLIPHSLVKGAPGVYWSIDALYNGFQLLGYEIYKGTWSTSTNDIAWAFNYSVSPTYLAGFGQNYNIAFDPSGQNGWFCSNAHVSGGPTTAAYYPNLWRTTNGGNSWTGPITVDLSTLGCFSSFISGSNVPSVNLEHDLVVDIYGNPHIITTILNSSSYGLFYNQTHYMYDITLVNGVWAAYPLGSVNGAPMTWGTGADIAVQTQAPQAARTADGSKVFFTWTDNASYSLGGQNNSPNLYTKAFDVQQKLWTQAKEVTSCNNVTAGKILFPHIAPEVLQPSSNAYKVAVMYSEMSVANTPTQVANFYYIDNVNYAASEFSVALPSHSVSIQQGSSFLYCPGSTVSINVTGGAGQAIWNTGATSPTISVTSNTSALFIVTAQKNCIVGSDSISLVTLTLNASAQTAGACPGNTVGVSVTGNANSYTWTPGPVTGSTAVLVAGNSPVFTVQASGTGCISERTVGYTLLSPPTINVLGNDTACSGASVTYTATGASTYLWDGTITGDQLTVAPTQNTVYTVVGTAANTCTNSTSINITVIPSPTILTSSSHTAICVGKSATLVAIGVNTWSWSTGGQTNAVVVSPTVTSTYTVTGTAANKCTVTHEYTIVVNALPSLTVTTNRPTLCKGEKAKLTVSGANTYTWSNPAATSLTIQVSPTITTVYTVTGKSADGCVNTYTFSQLVDPCADIAERQPEQAISLYPNPSNGEVLLTGATSPVFIYDQLGREVKHIDLTDLNDGSAKIVMEREGLYFVVCGPACRKLIISR